MRIQEKIKRQVEPRTVGILKRRVLEVKRHLPLLDIRDLRTRLHGTIDRLVVDIDLRVPTGSTDLALTLTPLNGNPYRLLPVPATAAVFIIQEPNGRTDRHGWSVAFKLETDAARPRSVQ